MRSIRLATIFALLIFMVACGGGSQGNSPQQQISLLSIQITGPTANLVAGQSQQMTATGNFSDKSSQSLTNSVQWSSSNSSVAAIAAGGSVTAKAAGSCSITATMSGVSGSYTLTVSPALVSIAVMPATPTIAANTNQQFIATGTFSDGSTQNITGTVTWTSSNTGAATISSASPTQGLARGLAGGSTTITASSGAILGTATLNVTNATVSAITVSPANPSLPLGLALQLTATATFSDGTTQDITDVAAWTSSLTSVATITISGIATARNIGTTTISAAFESVSGNTSLTVNVANLQSISITPVNSNSPAGVNVFFTATGTFNDGGTRNLTQQVTWSSSNTSVLTIGSRNGAASSIAPGTVTVTATLGTVAGSTTFTVTNATIVSISMTPATAAIPIGGHTTFNATGVFSDSSTANLNTIATWSSSNTAIATVGNTQGSFGTAFGASAGNVTISATFTANGATAMGSVPLTVDSGTLTGLSLQPGNTLIAPGSVVQYGASGSFSDGTKESMSQFVSWSSSNNNIATVAAGGVATGQSAGSTTITAQLSSFSASATLVVESSNLSSIQITPQSTNDPVTIQVQFRAIGTFANGDKQDLTSAVTWTSSSSSIATISNGISSAGVATGIQPGTTTISAAFAGQVGTATLTVTDATITAIAIAPQTPSISLGSSQQMSATATFSDGSSLNITDQADWSSSDPSVATINQFGVASSVASGTTTLKASLSGVGGTAILTVQ